METEKTDIVIVGTGASGLFAALHLPRDKRVLMITKDEVENSDSFLAQGGICVLHDKDDYDSFMEDTLKAGHYENRRESVDIMIRSSRPVINELIGYGVDFARKADGSLDYTREGCHSRPRILFHEDITGKEITSHLLAAVRQLPNVTIRDFTTMVDIVTDENRCLGIIARDSQGRYRAIQADETILASGGVGGLYDHSTNFPHLTGDALAIAMRHGVELEHIDYVQIHPTSLYSKKPGRSFLISESVRGEGAKLRGKDGQRFANEVLPRDLMTAEIRKQMKKDDLPFVWLDMTVLGEDVIKHHSRTFMNAAWKTASMRRRTGSRSCRPSTTSWVASTSTSTARRRWTSLCRRRNELQRRPRPQPPGQQFSPGKPGLRQARSPAHRGNRKAATAGSQCRRVCPSLCAVRSFIGSHEDTLAEEYRRHVLGEMERERECDEQRNHEIAG